MAKYTEQARAGIKAFETHLTQVRKWHINVDYSKLSIDFGVTGEDLPMRVFIFANENTGMLYCVYPFPGSIPENKRVEMAAVINQMNDFYGLGTVEFDISKGEILYRQTTCLVGLELTDRFCGVCISYALDLVDKYNDKFVMYAQGKINAEQLIALIKN